VRLDLDLPLPLAPEQLRITPQFSELLPALEKAEFRTLHAEMAKEAGLTPDLFG